MIDTTRETHPKILEDNICPLESLSDVATQIAQDPIDMTNVIAFTWTPDPLRYPSPHPRAQWKMLVRYILLASPRFFRSYMFVPEINQAGNIHVHGWYILKDKIAYFKTFLPKCRALGYVKLKYKVDVKWFQYCEKEVWDITQPSIGYDLYPLICHENIDQQRLRYKQCLKPRPKHYAPKYVIKDVSKYFKK